jgi:hypothetical protein
MPLPLDVADLFRRELTSRGIPHETDGDGRYRLVIDGNELTVALDALASEVAADPDPLRVARFVDVLVSAAHPVPPWSEAKGRLRFVAEPAELDFSDALYEQVSDSLCRVLAYVHPGEARVTWLTPAVLIEWGKTPAKAGAVAAANMAALLSDAKVRVERVEGGRIGEFDAPTGFKASLLFCPNLRDVIEPELGWPVFAVVPCRDRAYLIPEEDEELLSALGPAAVREFEGRPDPVSTEVFLLSDDGVEAVAQFREEEEDEDGMRTVELPGGARFRVPATWAEEYDDEGNGVFYEPEDDSPTLRATVIEAGARPSGADAAGELLAPYAAKHNALVETLETGNALLAYEEAGDEDGAPVRTWYWLVADAPAAGAARIALFSLTTAADRAEDEDVLDALAMLGYELRQCEFGE